MGTGRFMLFVVYRSFFLASRSRLCKPTCYLMTCRSKRYPMWSRLLLLLVCRPHIRAIGTHRYDQALVAYLGLHIQRLYDMPQSMQRRRDGLFENSVRRMQKVAYMVYASKLTCLVY